ncbi:MAG: GNAT family N-acetyltransferase [Candidatus Micrarchaeota archaeon]|nr:GNAT family N-acetyltransferase [Candidatus Micrarchaeota archaeon]
MAPKQRDVSELVRKRVEAQHLNIRQLIEKVSPGLFPQYTVLELSRKNVPKRPSMARKESKIEGERLFSEAVELLAKVLPDQGDRKDTLRRWIHRQSKNVLFFHVAIDKSGSVVGAALTDFIPDMNVAFFLRIAVDKHHRGRGIARLLVKERIWRANQESEKRGKGGIDYAITEIARPAIYGKPEEEHNFMRNIVRLSYHQQVSKFRAIAAPDGSAIGSKWYIFAINTIRAPDQKFISAREAGRLLHWYYARYNNYSKTPEGREMLRGIFNKLTWRAELSWKDIVLSRKTVLEAIPEHLMLELKPLSEIAMADAKVAQYIRQQKKAGKRA